MRKTACTKVFSAILSDQDSISLNITGIEECIESVDEVRLHYSKKAEMGVGTLIIFISLLLVAAVAAGVLIQTSSALQQKALSTGSQATDQVSTNIQVVEVAGEDGSDQDVESIGMVARLAPGSDSINFDELTLTVSLSNNSSSHQYGTGPSTTSFSVTYLQTGVNNLTGVFVRGDVVQINLTLPRAIVEGELVRVNLLPKIGSNTQVQFYTPDVMSTQQVYLYP